MTELRPPFDDPSEHTSEYGRTFWVCLVVGSACIAFGLWSLFSHAGSTHPVNFAAFFIGLALVHDLIVAPAALATASVTRKEAPRLALGLILGVLMVSAVVTLFAIPAVFGWGRQPDNPSFLPRNYGMGLLLVLGLVWAIAAVMLARRARSVRRVERG
jgi:uncharacterized membrane protein